MSFSEVREYQLGDDVRAIDWNVTARLNHPYIKVFEEERELTVMLLVDISSSVFFGSSGQSKQELITELCAVLAFSAITNNDKVGLLLFSDRIEKFIPPKKGKTHILRIIRELLETEPAGTKTDIAIGLEQFSRYVKKRCIAFLLSDFRSADFRHALNIAARRHDLVCIKVVDPLEEHLPNAGLIKIQNAETGAEMWLDSSSFKVRRAYHEQWAHHQREFNQELKRAGIDLVELRTNKPYTQDLAAFFKNRGKRR